MQTHWEKLDLIFKKSLVEKDISIYAKTLCLYAIGKIFHHVGVDVQLKSYFEMHYADLFNVFKEIDNVARDERIRISLRNFIGEKLQIDLGLDIELPFEDRHFYRLDDNWLKLNKAPSGSADPLGYLFGTEEQGGYNYKSHLDRMMAQDPATFSELKYATHLLRFSLPVLSRRLAQRHVRHENKAKEAEQFFTAIKLSESLIHFIWQYQTVLADTDKKLILRFYEACFICQKELVLPLKGESDFLNHLSGTKDHYLPGSVLKQQHMAILLDRLMKDQKGVALSETVQSLILEIFAEKMTATEAPSFYRNALELLEKSRAYFLVPQAILKAQILNHQAIKTLLNHFLMQATTLLGGLPPCALNLMLLGSSSRQDRLPYSDVEMALLYADTVQLENPEKKQLEINHFVAALLALLELQIIYLGESQAEKQGFWLDSSTSFRNDAYLRNNPSYVIQALYEKQKDTKEWKFFKQEKNPRGLKMHSFLYDASAYSLIQPDWVNQHQEDLSPFTQYQDQLKTYLDEADVVLLTAFADLLEIKVDTSEVTLKKRETIALWVWWDVLRCIEDHMDPSAQTVDLKKVLHKPIAYLVLGVRLYYAFPIEEAASLEAILIMAVNRKVLSVALGDFLLKMLEWVVSQRAALHLQCQKQVETLALGSLDSWMQHRVHHLVAIFKLFEKAMTFGLTQLPQKVYGLSLDALLADYLLDSLQSCQTAEQYQQWFIAVNLYLLYTKALLETHRYYYRQLPPLQREGCLRAAEHYFENKADKTCWRQEAEFWAQLWDAPLPDGRRRKHVSAKQRWEQQLSSFLSQPARGIPRLAVNITRLNGKKHTLPTSMVHALLAEQWIDAYGKFIDKKKHPIAKEMSGNHLVIAWPKDNPQFYLKVYPEYPLVELFLNELTSRLGYFESREVDLWLWESGEYSYPVLVSQAVPGKSLQTMLTDDLPLSLNSYSFSQSMMLSTLTSQEDGKPDNSIVFYDAQAGFRLCPIDADRWFAPTFKGGWLHAKDIIFCLSNMSDGLDPVFREDFLCLNPQQVLQAWVKRLEALGEQCIRVFGGRIETYLSGFTRNDDRKTLLLPPLKFHAVQELFHQLQQLKDLLANASTQKQTLTHWQVLSVVNPRQANHYLLVHEKHKKALERFEYAAGHAYIRGKGNQQEYFTSKIDFKTQMQDMWEGLPSKNEIRLNWERDIQLARQQLKGLMEGDEKIKAARAALEKGNLTRFKDLSQKSQEKLLERLDWQVLTKPLQRDLLNFMVTQGHWLNLIIQNSQEVNDSDLERLLQKSPSLKRLALMNNQNISEAIWTALLEHDSLLEAIHLEQLPRLTSLGEIGGFPLYSDRCLNLPNLRALSVIHCEQLKQINIRAEILENLYIKKRESSSSAASQLKVLRTQSKKLAVMHLDGVWHDEWHLMMNFEYAGSINHFTCHANIHPNVTQQLQLITEFPLLVGILWVNYPIKFKDKAIARLGPICADIKDHYALISYNHRQQLLDKTRRLLENYLRCESLLSLAHQGLKNLATDASFHQQQSSIDLRKYQVKHDLIVDSKETIEWFLKQLDSADIDVDMKLRMVATLAQLGHVEPQVIMCFEKLLVEDDDPELKVQLATALIQFGQASPESIQILVQALVDKDPIIRIRAAAGLANVKEVTREIITGLVGALNDADSYPVRIQAAQALEKIIQTLTAQSMQWFIDLKEKDIPFYIKEAKSAKNHQMASDGIFAVKPKAKRPALPRPEGESEGDTSALPRKTQNPFQ